MHESGKYYRQQFYDKMIDASEKGLYPKDPMIRARKLRAEDVLLIQNLSDKERQKIRKAIKEQETYEERLDIKNGIRRKKIKAPNRPPRMTIRNNINSP